MKTNEMLNNFLMEVQHLANKDFDASSDELFCECPGGKARPACSYIAEAGLLNSASAEKLRNPSAEIDMGAKFATLGNYNSLQASREAFNKGVQDLSEAILATSDDDLDTEISAPWGMPTTKGKLILHSIAHAMYHLGQLNQMQLIKGDEEVHWM